MGKGWHDVYRETPIGTITYAVPDPDVGLCIVCGENWCEDTRCDRCKRNLEEDRLNRELGR